MTTERVVLVFHVRPARSRSSRLAAFEALAMLDDLDAAEERGGPLGEAGPVAWVSIPAGRLDDASERLPRLGYSTAVDLVERARPLRVRRLYEEDPTALRNDAVDRRSYDIDTGRGPHEVRGYRGDSGSLSRRGLAVPDARLLVNLASPGRATSFLDPFAGAGGLLLAAAVTGASGASADVDPVVAPGLAAVTGGRHVVADAAALPYRHRCFDAVGGETPFDSSADDVVVRSLAELRRVCRPRGRIALMCPERQAVRLRTAAGPLGLEPFVDETVDRKGLAVTVVGWLIRL